MAPKKHKEGSVHKLLMLLAVPKIQELHHNMSVLLAELGLESLDFVITSNINSNSNFIPNSYTSCTFTSELSNNIELTQIY